MRHLLWLVGALLITTCTVPTAPALGTDVTRVTPPAAWLRWYHVAEQCAQRTGDVAHVRWYLAPGPWTGPDGATWTGAREGRAIVLAGPTPDSALVVHESLHDVLWLSGWRPSGPRPWTQAELHPDPPFGHCVPPALAHGGA